MIRQDGDDMSGLERTGTTSNKHVNRHTHAIDILYNSAAVHLPDRSVKLVSSRECGR